MVWMPSNYPLNACVFVFPCMTGCITTSLFSQLCLEALPKPCVISRDLDGMSSNNYEQKQKCYLIWESLGSSQNLCIISDSAMPHLITYDISFHIPKDGVVPFNIVSFRCLFLGWVNDARYPAGGNITKQLVQSYSYLNWTNILYFCLCHGHSTLEERQI